MKTILLWDPRFPDRRPLRFTVEDTVASAAASAGVAAAADPAQAGALSAGAALDPGLVTEVMLQHGSQGTMTRRFFLPFSVVLLGAAAGVLAAIGKPFASGTPTPTPTADNILLAFGDSITRHDYNPDSYTAPKTLRQNNVGEYRAALSRMGVPILFENYLDTANTRPADSESSGSTIPVNGHNYGQSGGTFVNIELAVELARLRGVSPKIIVYEGGVNNYNVANDGTFNTQSARLAYASLLDRIADYWPNAILVRANVRACGPRGITPTSAINTQINADVAARPNWTLLDMAGAYGAQDAADFQGDLVHPGALGASRKGAPAIQAMLTNKFGALSNVTAANELVQLGSPLAGTATAFSNSFGSGQLPLGVTFGSAGPAGGGTVGTGVTVTTAVVTSTNTNRTAIRLTIVCAGGGQVGAGLGLTFTGATSAGAYVESKVIVRDSLLGLTNLVNALSEASDATTYADTQVPAYPTNRTGQVTTVITPPRKALAGSTGLVSRIDVQYDASVAQTYVVDIEDWKLYTRNSPEVSYPDPDTTTYDTDAAAYFTAAKLRGATVRAAINALIVGFKSAGLWSKLDYLYMQANWSRTSGFVNLKAPGATAATYVAGDWRPRGFKGFGITEASSYPTAYYAAGTSQFQQDSASIFVFATEQDATIAEGVQLGTNNNTQIAMIRPVLGGTDKYRLNTATEIAVANPGTRAGFRAVSRTAANLTTAYYGSGGSVAAVGTTAAASVAPDTAIPRVLGTSLGGPVFYGGDRIGASGSGAGLSASDMTVLYELLRAYLLAVGAPVA